MWKKIVQSWLTFFIVLILVAGIFNQTVVTNGFHAKVINPVRNIDDKVVTVSSKSFSPLSRDYSPFTGVMPIGESHTLRLPKIPSVKTGETFKFSNQTSLDLHKSNTAYELGQTMEFWAIDFYKMNNGKDDDSDGVIDGNDYNEYFYKETFTIRAITNNTVIAVAGDVENDTITTLASQAEEVYDVETGIYGPPLDVDSDSKVFILVYDIKDPYYYGYGFNFISGYFYALHEYPKGSNPNDITYYSNYKEIINLDLDPSNVTAGDTLSHEFEHLVHFSRYYEDPSAQQESVWVDEGLAMLSEYLMGYGPSEFYYSKDSSGSFGQHPEVSLTHWDYYDQKKRVLANYGAAFLFMLYLYERYGGNETLSALIKNPQVSGRGIEAALQSRGYTNVSFQEVFRNWTITNYLNSYSLNKSLTSSYSYDNVSFGFSLNSFESIATNFPNTFSFSAPPWGTQYIRLEISQPTFTMLFNATTAKTPFLVTLILQNSTDIVIQRYFIPENQEIQNIKVPNFTQYTDKMLIVSPLTSNSEKDYDDENPGIDRVFTIYVNIDFIKIEHGEVKIDSQNQSVKLIHLILEGWDENSVRSTSYQLINADQESVIASGILKYINGQGWESDEINLNGEKGTYIFRATLTNNTHVALYESPPFTIDFSEKNESSSESTRIQTTTGVFNTIPTLTAYVTLISLASATFWIRKLYKKRQV